METKNWALERGRFQHIVDDPRDFPRLKIKRGDAGSNKSHYQLQSK